MRAICPSCNSNDVMLNMDVEVGAVFDDGTVEVIAPTETLGYGTLVCDDCGTVEDRNEYGRQAWIQAAIDSYDRVWIDTARSK